MSRKLAVIGLSAILLLYIIVVGTRAVALVGAGLDTHQPVAVVMGIGMILFPVIAAWALGRELVFGVQAERLAKRLEVEGGLPTEQVTTSASGRISRADGERLFPTYRAEVEQNESDWRAWYRVSLAYSAAGDSRRARAAVREAIRLEKTAR
ncbi:MAG: hypothetical protein QM607_04780 [Microbacterium sp.]